MSKSRSQCVLACKWLRINSLQFRLGVKFVQTRDYGLKEVGQMGTDGRQTGAYATNATGRRALSRLGANRKLEGL
jgi:hypothetical protein